MEFADPSGLISVFGRTDPLFLRSLIGFDDFERDTTAVAELVAVVLAHSRIFAVSRLGPDEPLRRPRPPVLATRRALAMYGAKVSRSFSAFSAESSSS